MNDVILNVLNTRDEVPDDPGILGDLDPQGIFNSSHGADGVYRCSDASYALRHQPGAAGVPSWHDDLQPAEHRAGTPGIDHLPSVDLQFEA